MFIFAVGIILLATLALLPLFLQNLMGYPVITTGFVLAPCGTGMIVAMMIVGQLTGRVDVRTLFLAGLLLTAYSLWEMSGFTMEVSAWTIVSTGVVQGLGLGVIFAPVDSGLRDPRAPLPDRERGAVQPDAQYLLQCRSFHDGDAARPGHAAQPYHSRRRRQLVQRCATAAWHFQRLGPRQRGGACRAERGPLRLLR